MKKLFFVWLAIIYVISILSNDPNSLTVVAASLVCGLTSMYIWKKRDKLKDKVKKWKKSDKEKFIWLGVLGALWAEFLYWFFEKVFGGTGIAAASNLIYNWIATMPWYIIMVVIFYYVVKKYKYSLYSILILGGIYELGTDGFLGSIINDRFPELVLLGIVGFPIFIATYSIIVLPPYLLIDFNNKESSKLKRYLTGLLPLLGIIPYYIILLILFQV